MERTFRILYTEDGKKKHKIFHDGSVSLSIGGGGCLVILSDEDGKLLRRNREKEDISKQFVAGGEVNFGMFLIQVEEETTAGGGQERDTTTQPPIMKPVTKPFTTSSLLKPMNSSLLSRPSGTRMTLGNRSFQTVTPGSLTGGIGSVNRLVHQSVVSPSPVVIKEEPTSSMEKEGATLKKPKLMSKPDAPRSQCNTFHSPMVGFVPQASQPTWAERVAKIELDPGLMRLMKPHQIDGANFLLDVLIRKPPMYHRLSHEETLRGSRSVFLENDSEDEAKDKDTNLSFKQQESGAILADEMGLGKTLTTISIMWTLAKSGIGKTVIVCPASLIDNWVAEIKKWLSVRLSPLVVKSSTGASAIINTFVMGALMKYPVLVISYDLFRTYASNIQTLSTLKLLVCDEGHRLKNAAGTKTTASLTSCRAPMKLVLTGTPVQNDLDELYALVSFVAPGLLGTLASFKANYVRGIAATGAVEIEVSKENSQGEEVIEDDLTTKVSKIMLRRTQNDVLRHLLPPRHDHTIYCGLPVSQAGLYDRIADTLLSSLDSSFGDDEDWGDDDEAEEVSSSSSTCVLPILLELRRLCVTGVCSDSLASTAKLSLPGAATARMMTSSTNAATGGGFAREASKLLFIDSMLRELRSETFLKEKLVIVSNFTTVLDVVERIVNSHGMGPVLRLDGSVPIANRQPLVDTFNSSWDNRRIFLLSSKSGGVGLNLIGGSRLVMMDMDWNPATDKQAMSRIWRQGQKLPVHIYRLVTYGTIDECVLDRQVNKSSLTSLIDAEKGSSEQDNSRRKVKLNFTKNEIRRLVYPRKKRTSLLLNVEEPTRGEFHDSLLEVIVNKSPVGLIKHVGYGIDNSLLPNEESEESAETRQVNEEDEHSPDDSIFD